MPVRCHGSHPYLDATRGALAIARGPLIYCAEQQDSDANIDDLVLTAADMAGASAGLYPELPEDAGPEGTPAQAVLIPCFLWANRGANAMRVWLRRA
jgi:DUF1680 family protein